MIAEIVRDELLIGVVHYQNSSSQLSNCRIFATEEEASANRDGWYTCTCGGQHEDAFLVESNWYWPVKICPTCNVVVTNFALQQVFDAYPNCGTCGKAMCFDESHEREYPREGRPLVKNETAAACRHASVCSLPTGASRTAR